MPDGERWNPPNTLAERMRVATHRLRASSEQDYPARRREFDTVFKAWTEAGRPPWR